MKVKVKPSRREHSNAFEVPRDLPGDCWRLDHEYEVYAIEKNHHEAWFLFYHLGWRWVNARFFLPEEMYKEIYLPDGYEKQRDGSFRKPPRTKQEPHLTIPES